MRSPTGSIPQQPLAREIFFSEINNERVSHSTVGRLNATTTTATTASTGTGGSFEPDNCYHSARASRLLDFANRSQNEPECFPH